MTEYSEFETAMMARAIELADKGKYTTSPNPRVGCVITQGTAIVGEGCHMQAGEPHAEVFALRAAGERAKGATVFVTLEPCCHYGRTPPCVEALINARVAKVFVALEDPFPQVAGKGVQQLRDAGIEVVCGLLQQQAQQLNQGFLHRVITGLPWVTAKMATSLDGRIALANGVSKWITGAQARADVQEHRAQSCAIVTGSGTVIADDPALNVRYGELTAARSVITEEQVRQPLRVIIDGKNQLHHKLTLFSLPGDVMVVNLSYNEAIPEHVAQWQAPIFRGRVDLRATLQELAAEHINWVWLEAGNGLFGTMLQQQLINETIHYLAPKLLGDSARGSLAVPELTAMAQAYQLQWTDIRQLGSDLKITSRVDYQRRSQSELPL